MKKRNYELDFWKFIASIFVVIYHSHSIFDGEKTVYINGYMAVELFFVISGYLFASSVYRDTRPFNCETIGKETWSFMKRKVKGFLYFYIIGFLGTFIAKIYSTDGKITDAVRIPGYILDFLLFGETGLPTESILSANWYLSSMIIAMFVLYPVFRYKKRIFSQLAAPVITVTLMSYIFKKVGTVAMKPSTNLGLFTGYTLLAFAEISLGVCAYEFSELIKKKEFSGKKKGFISFAGTGSIILAFVLTDLMGRKSSQPLIILLFFLFVSISGSGKSSVTRIFKKRPCEMLGKLSMSLYLTHGIVRCFIVGLKNNSPFFANLFTNKTSGDIFVSILIYLVLCMAVAFLTVFICDGINNKKSKSIKQSNKNNII